MSRETGPAPPDSGTSGHLAHYRLDELIGRGGMAAVYLARDERLDRKVALKVLAPELARDDAFRTRFLRESRAAAAVNHPNIIPVYEADETSGILYIAMRYVQGPDARSLLNRLGPLPFAWAWSIVAQVAAALDAAHAQGLIHRDVKPANMLLDASGAADGRAPGRADGSDFNHVYLTDFGLSKNPPPGESTAARQLTGALDYAPPEQIEGRALDGRADLYSLACTGFELLCGTPPFGQDQGLTVMYAQLYAPPPTATARRPDLPAAVDRVLARALAKNPADRYPTCLQFAAELQTALGLLPGAPGDSARLDSPGQDAPVTAVMLPAGAAEPAGPDGHGSRADRHGGQRGFEPQPTLATAPVLSGPGRPPAGPLPGGPSRASVDMVSEQDWLYPRQSWRLPGGRALALTVAAVVIVAAAIAVGVLLLNRSAPGTPAASSHAASPAPSSPSSPSAATPASRQAAAVSNLLVSSAAARKALQGPVIEVRACTNVSSAVSQIQDVVNQRSTEDSQASALTTAALADGGRVKSDLIAALRSSLAADRDYLAWAKQQLTSGCTPGGPSSAYNAAVSADQQAGTAKEAFVRVWNPIAARYGVPRTSASSI